MNCEEYLTCEPLEWFFPFLMKVDFTKTSTKLILTFCSLVTCIVLFVSSALLSSYIDNYRQLVAKQKVFWNLATVRASYGIYFTLVGIWGVFVHKEFDNDVVFGTSQTSHFAVTATVGFFLFESFALGLSDFLFSSFSMLLHIHHWICLIYSLLVLNSDISHSLFVKGLLLEGSTPFSALSWILLKCRKERTMVWLINQYILVHIFHCRNIVEIYFIYNIYKNWTHIWQYMPPSILIIICILSPAITCIMTPYWTYKKTVQLVTPYDFNFEKEIPRPNIKNSKNKIQ